MMWDISFCDNKGCSKKDCKRHFEKSQQAFREGAKQLSYCSWIEEDCEAYWKDEK